MKKTIALLTILVALVPTALTAQTAKASPPAKSEVILAYVGDDLQMTITDPSGNPAVVKEGMKIPVGSVLRTQNTDAELQLRPNKSIIKLSAKTTFTIKSLKDGEATGSNDFELATGKIRAVAAKLTGATTPGYNIATRTANCGVRGTDFAMKYDETAKMDWVCVQEGQVDFTNALTGDTVSVASGQFANTFDPVFRASTVTADRLAELFSDVDFVRLDPKEVPGKEIAATTQNKAPETVAPPPPSSAAVPTPPEPAATPASPASDPGMEMLKNLFGLEVGSLTIQGTTYSKAVLTPVVAFDGFKLGLYLPIVYSSDMFDSQNWYRPEGNDEWSFGMDKSGLWDKTADVTQDLALKIKYLEWGVQGTDPFYVKVGNLKTMSLGHGTVVRNFANDQEFPAIRKIGLNAGMKLGPLVLEGLVDDVAKASVTGGRVALDLISDQIVLGVQATADWKLADAKDLAASGKTPASYGSPILMVGGIDLQLFKINSGAAFRTTAFVDANTLAVYYWDKSTEYGLPQGLDLKPVYRDGKLGSYGGETGLFGNLAVVDYRLSFQAERGLYSNGIFQGNYYRTRNSFLTAVGAYSAGTEAYRTEVEKVLRMGVFGTLGFDLGLVALEGAYRWPFDFRADGSLGPSDNDYLRLKLGIPKDKLPLVKLSGSISYERTQFIPSLRDKVNLFDANTLFRGEVVYGLAKGMDLVIGVGTATQRDGGGNVVYENGKPKVGPTVSLDTKVTL